jgi:hypothetical protein
MVMASVVDLFLRARRLSLALRGHDGMGKYGGAWHGKPSIVRFVLRGLHFDAEEEGRRKEKRAVREETVSRAMHGCT